MNSLDVKTNKKAKVERNYIAYVHVKWKNRDNNKAHKIENEKQLQSVENYLGNHIYSWKWASLKDINTNEIIHYYHPKAYSKKGGVERLDLKEYKEQFTAYSLYIIPTSAYKRKTGIQKGKIQRIYDIDQIHQYWTKDVLRIDVYVDGKKINAYENGRFLK